MAKVGRAKQLASELPTYQSTIRAKIAALKRSGAGSGVLSRAADVLQDLSKQLDGGCTRAKRHAEPHAGRTPDPGRSASAETRRYRNAAGLSGATDPPSDHNRNRAHLRGLHPIEARGPAKPVHPVSRDYDLQKTTAAFDDAGKRPSRQFLTQLIVNAGFGVVIGCGLAAIGVPSALLWGIVAAILRFIPYLGAVLSAVFPMVITASVDPGWMMLALTAALFVIAEPLAGHVIEPLAYGRSTGLSPIAIVVAATVWTWLWGRIGLVLATPLTVCLVVLGRHVERMEFRDVCWVTDPHCRRRRSSAEATDKAEEVLKERSVSAYYDKVALAGLRLAAAEEARGVLDTPKRN
jgi:hypothetical protein